MAGHDKGVMADAAWVGGGPVGREPDPCRFPSRVFRRRPAGSRVAVAAALFLVLGGWAREPGAAPRPAAAGIPLERLDLAREGDSLPAEVRSWAQEKSRRRGEYVKHWGDRTYLLVAWGEKPTGGYTVRVEEVARGRRGEVVLVRLTAPQPGDVVTEALTHPFDLVRTPRLTRPVTFAYAGGFTLAQDPAAGGGAAGKPAPEEQVPPGRATVARSQNFIVFTPAPGAVLQSPVTVAGLARVFEGSFVLELEDGHNVLARQTVQTVGAPAWGEFRVTLPFSPPTNPAGALLFVTYSAADGSRREELMLPVRFAFPR